MEFTRSISRPLLFLALVGVIASADIVEAGWLNGLKGALKDLTDKVKGVILDVTEANTKQFSVLSNFFGVGTTRVDLTLPQIFNNVFSRNNSVIVPYTDDNVKERDLGDGSSVIAAISTGGAIALTKKNGVVSITTGANVNINEGHSEDGRSDEGRDNRHESKKNNEENTNDNGTHENENAAPTNGSNSNKKDGTEVPQETKDDVTFWGSDLNHAFIQLLSDWESFVSSSIWDAQDRAELGSITEDSGNEDVLFSSSRVINGVFLGNRIASGAPFAVKFFYNNEKNFYCSGSLIGYPYVLTAAHCGVLLGDEVRVGGRLLRSGYKATVSEVFTHPKFDHVSLVHDVAIIRLEGLQSKQVLNENGVRAARINRNDSFPDAGFVGVVSAHGAVETDGRSISDVLRSTKHTVHYIDKCQEEITQGEVKKEESYLCAGDGRRSTTCVGDSGAGLWRYRMMKTSEKTHHFYEIFGVVSFGEVTDEALCPRGPPAVFQRTSKHIRWVQKVVGEKNML